MGHAKLAVLISRNWYGGYRCRFGGLLVPPAPLPLTTARVGAGTLVVFGDYQIAPIAARSTAMGRWRLTPPGYGGTCLPAGRSAGLTRHRPVIQRRGPLKGKANGGASFNTATHQGGRLEGVPFSNTGHSRGRLGGLYCALILLPALPNMSFQASSTLAASSWASWASSSAVTSPSGVWPRISSAT